MKRSKINFRGTFSRPEVNEQQNGLDIVREFLLCFRS